jgi:argininosuccinate lyase
MKKLWQKDWELEKAVEIFETKGDMKADQSLVDFDVYGTLAHVMMLKKIGILNETELQKVRKGLLEILALNKSGNFKLEEGDEDVHTKVENFITEKCGEVGKKIHTGRSRNDQVLTDLRLFTKSNLLQVWKEVISIAESFNSFAKKYEFVPMPGYTHMQKAMPSSVGMWAGAFTEGLLDDLEIIKAVYTMSNKSPLGSAAGYGVPLPLDREYTAKLLGFGTVQKNSLYTQNSRGKAESEIISGLIPVFLDINKFASDVMLFTTSEFDYFEVDKKLCSGSSIMPQKKNVDIGELLRSKVNLVLGYYVESVSLSSNLPSGYARDMQDGKRPLFQTMELAIDAIRAASVLLGSIHPNEDKMRKAMTSEIFATHNALRMTVEGMAFRDAYKIAEKAAQKWMPENIEKVIKESVHTGGTGNLGLDGYAEQIKSEKKAFEKEYESFNGAIKSLING